MYEGQRYFILFTLISALALCMVSCPKEFIPEDEVWGDGYLLAPLRVTIANETFENLSPGPLLIEIDGSPLDNSYGFFRLNLHAKVGRADITAEGRKNVLKLWQTTGPGGSGLRSDFIYVPKQETTNAIREREGKVLLQYRIRTPNVNNVNGNAVNVYHTRYVRGQPGGNTSVQTRLNGLGTFQINNNSTWELNPVKQNVWHTVEILIDYGTNEYQVYLNGTIFFDDYLFNQSSPALGTISWFCNNPNMALFVSDIRLSTDTVLW